MQLPDEVIAQVERRLDVRLDRSSARTGAWAESAGYRTDRDTWVRVDSRSPSVIQPQSWVGAEAASVIPGAPKPAWFQSATWAVTNRERVWRAEEMELVTEPVVAKTGTMLTTPPDLPDTWWAELRTALAALASFPTLRVAGRQELITRRISQVHAEFHEDLDCRSGKIARLWVCSNILRMADQRADAHHLAEPARAAADQLVKDLR